MLHNSISYKDCYIATNLSRCWSPYTAIHCQTPQHTPQHFVHILQPEKHTLNARPYEVRKKNGENTFNLLFQLTCTWFWSADSLFGQPHKKKSHVARLGFRRGHSIGSVCPIHRPGKWLATVIEKLKKKVTWL